MIDITSKFTPNSLKVRLSLIEYLLQLNNFHLAIKQNLFVVLDGAEYFINNILFAIAILLFNLVISIITDIPDT